MSRSILGFPYFGKLPFSQAAVHLRNNFVFMIASSKQTVTTHDLCAVSPGACKKVRSFGHTVHKGLQACVISQPEAATWGRALSCWMLLAPRGRIAEA